MELSIAKISDIKLIMDFLGKYWKKGHILSTNKELLLYEFKDEERLNFTIAKDSHGDIIGLFGFIKYNSLNLPDLAGSLWKVKDDCKVPMLGLKLREFTIKNIPHRFFAAPGAGLQTKSIYKIIKMDWNQMEHYYIHNDKKSFFEILKMDKPIKKYCINETIESNENLITKVTNIEELKNFDFNKYTNIVPFKDFEYIKKRFVDYPINKYDIYKVEVDGELVNIFICREVKKDNSRAYRVVDFYGNDSYLKKIADFLYLYIIDKDYEYFDFVCYGFIEENMTDIGFNKLSFENETIIVPNFFEPFVQKNIPIYCVSDKMVNEDIHFRQCKADGDQDRPNIIRNNNE